MQYFTELWHSTHTCSLTHSLTHKTHTHTHTHTHTQIVIILSLSALSVQVLPPFSSVVESVGSVELQVVASAGTTTTIPLSVLLETHQDTAHGRLTHPLTHYSHTHSLTHSLTHTLTHSPLSLLQPLTSLQSLRISPSYLMVQPLIVSVLISMMICCLKEASHLL